MSKTSSPEKFVFHEQIDKEFIFNLYEDDYAYVAEVFKSSLEAFTVELEGVDNAFSSGNLALLARSIHKIKPVFGFAGLLGHQEMISVFEKKCTRVNSVRDLKNDYIMLIKKMEEGREIIFGEYKRLNVFLQ